MKNRYFPIAFLVMTTLAWGSFTQGVAGQYEWQGGTLTGGGGVMTSAKYTMSQATAQPGEAGMVSAGVYVVRYGVLGWDAPAEDEGEGEGVLHPGDLNGDWRMTISEAIPYLSGWQRGSNPIAYAIRAAYLWQNGEYYSYNPELSPPLCWILD